MLHELQETFTLNTHKLIGYIFNKGYSCTYGETYRPPEMAEIYAKQGKGIINSLHCKRLAVDLNIFSPEGKYLTTTKEHAIFGEYWEALHPYNRWGGHFTRGDGNHFEMLDH